MLDKIDSVRDQYLTSADKINQDEGDESAELVIIFQKNDEKILKIIESYLSNENLPDEIKYHLSNWRNGLENSLEIYRSLSKNGKNISTLSSKEKERLVVSGVQQSLSEKTIRERLVKK